MFGYFVGIFAVERLPFGLFAEVVGVERVERVAVGERIARCKQGGGVVEIGVSAVCFVLNHGNFGRFGLVGACVKSGKRRREKNGKRR